MLKKVICIIILLVLTVSVFTLVGCEDKILKHFDLTEPKEYWTGTIEDDFSDDKVIIVLRKTSTYPELELNHFNLKNAQSMHYIALRPSENESVIDGYNQILVIYLKEHGKDKVIDAIKHLEKLKFVLAATPDGLGVWF